MNDEALARQLAAVGLERAELVQEQNLGLCQRAEQIRDRLARGERLCEDDKHDLRVLAAPIQRRLDNLARGSRVFAELVPTLAGHATADQSTLLSSQAAVLETLVSEARLVAATLAALAWVERLNEGG
jgi:hypothetical protein